MKATRTRVAMLAFSLVVLTASTASAQLIEVTPEVFATVERLATGARAKYPTSPEQAVFAFQTEFNGEFGNTWPSITQINSSPELDILVLTPINRLANDFRRSLHDLTALPDHSSPAFVSVEVQPKRTTAPNVTRLVLFLDGQEVHPVVSTLGPKEFKNGMGITFSKGAGSVAWKAETFKLSRVGPAAAVAFPGVASSRAPSHWALTGATSGHEIGTRVAGTDAHELVAVGGVMPDALPASIGTGCGFQAGQGPVEVQDEAAVGVGGRSRS